MINDIGKGITVPSLLPEVRYLPSSRGLRKSHLSGATNSKKRVLPSVSRDYFKNIKPPRQNKYLNEQIGHLNRVQGGSLGQTRWDPRGLMPKSFITQGITRQISSITKQDKLKYKRNVKNMEVSKSKCVNDNPLRRNKCNSNLTSGVEGTKYICTSVAKHFQQAHLRDLFANHLQDMQEQNISCNGSKSLHLDFLDTSKKVSPFLGRYSATHDVSIGGKRTLLKEDGIYPFLENLSPFQKSSSEGVLFLQDVLDRKRDLYVVHSELNSFLSFTYQCGTDIYAPRATQHSSTKHQQRHPCFELYSQSRNYPIVENEEESNRIIDSDRKSYHELEGHLPCRKQLVLPSSPIKVKDSSTRERCTAKKDDNIQISNHNKCRNRYSESAAWPRFARNVPIGIDTNILDGKHSSDTKDKNKLTTAVIPNHTKSNSFFEGPDFQPYMDFNGF